MTVALWHIDPEATEKGEHHMVPQIKENICGVSMTVRKRDQN